MIHTVHKYHFSFDDFAEVDMVRSAQIVHFAVQGNKPTIWALVNAEETFTERRYFRFVGTERPITDEPLSYIGTTEDGSFIWHLFEIKP